MISPAVLQIFSSEQVSSNSQTPCYFISWVRSKTSLKAMSTNQLEVQAWWASEFQELKIASMLCLVSLKSEGSLLSWLLDRTSHQES